jgi:hypothetical protein
VHAAGGEVATPAGLRLACTAVDNALKRGKACGA